MSLLYRHRKRKFISRDKKCSSWADYVRELSKARCGAKAKYYFAEIFLICFRYIVVIVFLGEPYFVVKKRGCEKWILQDFPFKMLFCCVASVLKLSTVLPLRCQSAV